MKLTACICLALTAAACGPSGAATLSSLPLGSEEALMTQLQKEVVQFGVALNKPPMPTGAYVGWPSNYNASMGSLLDVARTTTVTFLTRYINTNDAGKQISFLLDLASKPPGQSGFVEVSSTNYPKNFTAEFDANGKLVIPTNLISTPIADFIPISGGCEGVESVEYWITNAIGIPVITDRTANGAYSGCWYTTLATNGVLYLTRRYIDPDMLRSKNYSGEVRLHYSNADGLYDAFDVLTGQLVRSTTLHLRMTGTNGVQSVALQGRPGRQIAVETSPDMIHWSDADATVNLDASGSGVFVPVDAAQSRFFRGRFLP